MKHRFKVPKAPNFYVDELVHPEIYRRFGFYSLKFINPKLIIVLNEIRKMYGDAIFINTYKNGGRFINSGLRDIKRPYNGKLTYSRHYYGLCLDLKPKDGDIKKLYHEIMLQEQFFIKKGLTVIEDIKYTPTWLHISVEYTGINVISIIKP